MFWLWFPAPPLLPTLANTIVLKLKLLMRKCLFQWNFHEETQTDPEGHTDLKSHLRKPSCHGILSQSRLQWLIYSLSFFWWNIHCGWETDAVVWCLLLRINSLLNMRQRIYLNLVICILESTLATSDGLENTGSSSLFQKAKEVTTLQTSGFIFDPEK